RFGIVNDYLYTVSTSTLKTFHAAVPTNPLEVGSQTIGWNIETLYPFKDHLFIGSQTGMFVYSLTNPSNPQHVSSFAHATQCDPVIADDHFAYVTLRSGTNCQGFNNQLDVLDIDNINSPSLVKTLGLTNPRGLSKDGNLLFVCDGPGGLRILDASLPANVSVSQTIPMSSPNDVIAWDGIAYVVAEDGLYRFNYSGFPQVNAMGKLVFSK
ncbi:MAG TPA: hypothetical protein VEY71_12745, partial [Chitinophagales bacterium]|nr:hypothetical protein [Chitinophagales bacterium]